jgi:putative ABC transport system substrate-binding protein
MNVQRRDFIRLLGGATAAWPLAAAAQREPHTRLVGVLEGSAASPDQLTRLTVFRQTMLQLGWNDGGNVRFETRWGEGDADTTRKRAEELVALAPDAILAVGSLSLGALQQVNRSIPVVFMTVADPVGAGYVASLAQPGGNTTGFMLFEYSIAGKWPELLKQIAPDMKRTAVLRDPAIAAGIGQFAIIQSVAPSLGVDVIPFGMASVADIERSVATFASSPNGGLILTASTLSVGYSDLVIALAARYKLPAVYSGREYVVRGGLMAYGPVLNDQARRAAGYIDRVLKGEKPADLPVQAPTKYELVINLKTAKALGIDIPVALSGRADELIE